MLNIDVGPNGVCAVLPDPLTCFAAANFEQQIRIDLAEGGSLVLVDWLTSGRRARGEQWAFDRYRSRIDAYVGSQLKFRDSLLLDAMNGPIAAEYRMGRYDCFGTVLMLGNRVQEAADKSLAWAAAQPVARGNGLIFSGSPVAGGAVFRVAGPQTETVGRWIGQRLEFISELLGGDPWARKW
jgi:urease accessory protein